MQRATALKLIIAAGTLTLIIGATVMFRWATGNSSSSNDMADSNTAPVSTPRSFPTATSEPIVPPTPAPTATPTASPTPVPQPTPTPTPIVNRSYWDPAEYRAGLSIFELTIDEDSVGRFEESLTYYRELGVNTLIYVYHLYQDGPRASCIGPESPDWASRLTRFVELAHHYDFDVAVRPLLSELDFEDGQWRGSITPVDVNAWFGCYTDHLMDLAKLAEQDDVEAIVVGSEFSSMEADAQRWGNIILDLRQEFSGELTYAFNWDRFIDINHPFRHTITVDGRHTTVVDLLDYPGLDFYFTNQSLEQISAEGLVASWEGWLKPLVDAGIDLQNVMVVEFGLTAAKGAYQVPYAIDPTLPVDEDEQKAYYCAFFSQYGTSFRGVWVWLAMGYLPNPGRFEEMYNPIGRKAETVIREFYREGTLTTCENRSDAATGG